jgi:16S rRNA (guanine527-N7)-methyltransferase
VLSRLRAHCRALIAWNRSVSNLISKNDEARIVARHVAESLEPARWIAELGIDEWLDFGSGAGFPALPLAIAGIGRRWVLVESRRPKILFLRKTLSEIATGAMMEVVGSRLETVPGDSYRVEGFTARATEKLSLTLELASRFVAPGGSAFLWKGSRWTEEIDVDRSWTSWWRLSERRGISGSAISVARFERL